MAANLVIIAVDVVAIVEKAFTVPWGILKWYSLGIQSLLQFSGNGLSLIDTMALTGDKYMSKGG
jgi:hypothetical protein